MIMRISAGSFVAVCLACLTFAPAACLAQLSPATVADVEGQPLAANVARLIEALDYLGVPLPAEKRSQLQAAIRQRDAIALGMRMQPRTRVFDDIQNLSTQVAISVIYGVVETRDDHGIWLKGA